MTELVTRWTRSGARVDTAIRHDHDRDHWRRVHLASDRGPLFTRREPERPFWKPLWVERQLERGRAA